MRSIKQALAIGMIGLALVSVDVAAINVQKMLKNQGCLKCHAISRQKDGPSIKKLAAKYRDDLEATVKLRTHLTSSPEIGVEGKVEKHKQFEPKSATDLDEVIRWIRSH